MHGLVEQSPEVALRMRQALANREVQGAYLHVPFCFHKCHYCDFYSIVDNQDRQDAFVERLVTEVRAAAGWGVGRQQLQTIFVGGGTPTLLTPGQWRRLLGAVHEWLPLETGGEFTVEANPETVTHELATTLADGGVNRVSIGAQSFNERHLKTLERWHDPHNVARSIDILRHAGLNNINVDLIFGVPGQTLSDWLADLDAALALGPSHISCYGLMYESNTPLTRRMQAGQIQPVDQDVEAAMYEATIEHLGAAGFEQYEISNWARSACLAASLARRRDDEAKDQGALASQARRPNESARCRHNLLYWRNANWWAFGPSASGHVNGLRWKNVPRLGEYLADADGSGWPPIMDVEIVDDATAAGEQFMLGLRLLEGLALADVARLLSLSGQREEVRRAAIERHREAGLVEVTEDRLRMTRRGLLLANDVLVDLV
jgi:oxygen-independent coproporphyrinogen III oxidase